MACMTVLRAFTHEHNQVEVARQEWELASDEYHYALMAFDAREPKRVARFDAACERKRLAWERFWALTRGY